MRLIIEPNYEKLSKWVAGYVAKRINEFQPTAERPFVLGLPTGSSPIGTYKELIALNKAGKVLLILQGRIGSSKLKVTIKNIHIAGARTLSTAEGKIKCQLTKYQMCLSCKACESVCKYDAISVKDDETGKSIYKIDNERCVRCAECVGHFEAGCYMRKVLGIKRL